MQFYSILLYTNFIIGLAMKAQLTISAIFK